MSAALVLAAALADLARSTRAREEIWPVVVLLSALAAHQVTLTIVGLVAGRGAEPQTTWSLGVNVGLMAAVLAGSLLLPSLGLRPPPILLGVALGLAAAAALVSAFPLEVGDGSAGSQVTISVILGLGYAIAAVIVHRQWPWGEMTRAAMTLAVLLLGAAHATAGLAGTTVWAGVVGVDAQFAAAGLLTTSMYIVVRDDLVAHRRHIHALRARLLAEEEQARRARSHQHTMRNLVAGITMAAELLEDDALELPTRRRLEHTLHLEARRLCGLFEAQHAAPAARAVRVGSPTTVPPRELRTPDPVPRPALQLVEEGHVQHRTGA